MLKKGGGEEKLFELSGRIWVEHKRVSEYNHYGSGKTLK